MELHKLEQNELFRIKFQTQFSLSRRDVHKLNESSGEIHNQIIDHIKCCFYFYIATT